MIFIFFIVFNKGSPMSHVLTLGDSGMSVGIPKTCTKSRKKVLKVSGTLLLLDRVSTEKKYLLKVNNENTTKRYKICSNLTIKTPERHQ